MKPIPAAAAALAVSLAALAPIFVLRAQETIHVTLDQPSPFEPAHGPVEIVAVVAAGEEIERVSFYVDGILMGEVEEPPYRLTVDVGSDNVEHQFQAVAYGASGATGSAMVRTPEIRVDEEVSVNLRQLYVTVTRGGERVSDLERVHFEILDEGKRQEMVTFARGDIPFAATVLLDSSVSMRGAKLAAAVQGARAFFTGMKPLDEAKLLVFSDRILHSTPFTTFPQVLTAGLSRVEPRGGTAVADHLYLALTRLEARQGRRVVVLLSDGVDSHSVLEMSEVLAAARRSQALIYWLRLPYGGEVGNGDLPHLTTAWRDGAAYQREFDLLRRTVEESGGRIELLASTEEIAPAFRGILAELRDQYVLGYYPKVARGDGSWRRVRVRVRHPGVTVRSQNGYLDLF